MARPSSARRTASVVPGPSPGHSIDPSLTFRIGCAGWNIPKQHDDVFPRDGSHLARYQRQFNAGEINSSFYRSHRPATYRRWAVNSPEEFRFAVKAPRTVTHEHRLKGADDLLKAFLGEVAELGEHLGPLLFQLPPSLRFSPSDVENFLELLRGLFSGALVLEPRHTSWLGEDAAHLLRQYRVAMAAADPPLGPEIAPAGSSSPTYYRLHGHPRMYYSPYSEGDLARLTRDMFEHAAGGHDVWCIFDNTADGAAQTDALTMQRMLAARRSTLGR